MMCWLPLPRSEWLCLPRSADRVVWRVLPLAASADHAKLMQQLNWKESTHELVRVRLEGSDARSRESEGAHACMQCKRYVW